MSGNAKKIIIYMLFLIYIGLVFISGFAIQEYLKILYTTVIKSIPLEILHLFVPTICGFLIALPNFILKLKSTGTFKLNLAKFLIFGIPTLYITLIPFLAMYNFPFTSFVFSKYISKLILLSSIGLGYILLDSFEKEIK